MTLADYGTVSPTAIWAEPDDNGQFIRQAVAKAQHSVDISIYEIGGPQILETLAQAKLNGVSIRIMFNGQFFAGPDYNNQRYDNVYSVIQYLQNAPGKGLLSFYWSSNNFNITHQKTIILDAFAEDGSQFTQEKLPKTAQALVLSLNLCQYAWMKSDAGKMQPIPWAFWGPQADNQGAFSLRDFGAAVADPALVYEIASAFASDISYQTKSNDVFAISNTNGLVWSNGSTGIPGIAEGYYPVGGQYPAYHQAEMAGATAQDQGNSRAIHLALINEAKKTLHIYNEEMNDDEIVAAIVAACQRGVQVSAILTANTSSYKGKTEYQFASNYNLICQAGAQVRLFAAAPGVMYIHAKVLLADAGTDDAVAYMGSENISGNSLNFNRELGIITRGSDTTLFFDCFTTDWNTPNLLQWPSDGTSPTAVVYPDALPIYNPGPTFYVPVASGEVKKRTGDDCDQANQ